MSENKYDKAIALYKERDSKFYHECVKEGVLYDDLVAILRKKEVTVEEKYKDVTLLYNDPDIAVISLQKFFNNSRQALHLQLNKAKDNGMTVSYKSKRVYMDDLVKDGTADKVIEFYKKNSNYAKTAKEFDISIYIVKEIVKGKDLKLQDNTVSGLYDRLFGEDKDKLKWFKHSILMSYKPRELADSFDIDIKDVIRLRYYMVNTLGTILTGEETKKFTNHIIKKYEEGSDIKDIAVAYSIPTRDIAKIIMEHNIPFNAIYDVKKSKLEDLIYEKSIHQHLPNEFVCGELNLTKVKLQNLIASIKKKHNLPKLRTEYTKEDINKVMELKEQGYSHVEIAKETGVLYTAISAIVAREEH